MILYVKYYFSRFALGVNPGVHCGYLGDDILYYRDLAKTIHWNSF